MSMNRVCGIPLKARNDNHQITDLLQLSRREQESRHHCFHVMRRRRAWKTVGTDKNNFQTIYVKIEGLMLVKQVRHAILFYKLVKGHRIIAFNRYLEKLSPCSPSVGGAR